MRQIKRISLLILLTVILVSCKKFKERRLAVVSFNIQTEIGQTNFDLMNRFDDSQGRAISIELIKFYLSDLSFINEEGEEILTDDILLVELDKNGLATFDTKIEAGTYTAIKFGIGVPKAQNESDPSSFNEEGHPLNTTNNTYWGMNSMYRFVMIDGRYFENNTFVKTFSYHSGYNESFRTLQLNKQMTFEKKGNYSETIYIDVSKILEGPGGNLDIENKSNYHGSLDDFYLSEQISDNFLSAIRF